MTSILTNTSATAALATLRGITAQLGEEQGKISSGMRVQTAADNAAYWSIATTMKSDTRSMSAVTDSIGLGQAITDVTYNGLKTITETWTDIRNLLITAMTMPAPTFENPPWILVDNHAIDDAEYNQSEVAKIDGVIAGKLKFIQTVAASSNFNGVNLLEKPQNGQSINQADYLSIVSGYADGKVQTTDVNIKNFNLFNHDHGTYPHPTIESVEEDGILDNFLLYSFQIGNTTYGYEHLLTFNGPGSTVTAPPSAGNDVLRMIEAASQQLNGLIPEDHYRQYRQLSYEAVIQSFDEKLEAMVDGLSYLGSIQKSLATDEAANKKRIETNTKGIGRLVDADMNESSARLKALEAQQQLAVQALSVANAQPSRIVDLFR